MIATSNELSYVYSNSREMHTGSHTVCMREVFLLYVCTRDSVVPVWNKTSCHTGYKNDCRPFRDVLNDSSVDQAS